MPVLKVKKNGVWEDVGTASGGSGTIDAVVPMDKGGTGAETGEEGLKNLFADGYTVLSEFQYGDTLPTAGMAGRIFFKKVSNS